MCSGHGVFPLSLFAVLGIVTPGFTYSSQALLSPSNVASRFSYFDETFIQKLVFCRNRCEVLARGCLLEPLLLSIFLSYFCLV